MKQLLAVLVLAFTMISVAVAGGEEKKVCTTDSKTKKEVCKTIKTHKKVEGDKVPDGKKK